MLEGETMKMARAVTQATRLLLRKWTCAIKNIYVTYTKNDIYRDVVPGTGLSAKFILLS
jgi:hypothetical protein